MNLAVEIKQTPWWSLMPPSIFVTKDGRAIAEFYDLRAAILYRDVLADIAVRGGLFKESE